MSHLDGARRITGAMTALIAMVFTMMLGAAGAAEPDGDAATDEAAGRHIAFDARVAGNELRTRIVIDFESKPDFTVHYLDDPARVVIDLPDTVFALDEGALEARGLFEKIRYGAMAPGQARMVLAAIGPVELEIARVDDRTDGDGYRLVLDAVATSNSRFAELTDERGWLAPAPQAEGERVVSNGEGGDKPFTVVIDAGHGGIDSGAKGQAGTLEKDVTLAFAKAIAGALSEYDDIRVVLTREDDRFISLAGRVRIARQHEADVMMSVHADSIRLPDIRGATVYTLSDNASDRMAADLARRENRADEAAGVEFTETSDEVVDILMDLTRRETSVFSVGLARSVLDRLRGEVRLIGNAHRHAGFRVLTAHDVPSLLVELGYLSNKEDEQLLTDPEWREDTATLLAEAIHGFRKRMFAQAEEL